MRTVLVVVLFIIAFTSQAQRKCASSAYREIQRSIDPSYKDQEDQLNLFIRSQASSSSRETTESASSVIRIPVVVHIIYKNASGNLTNEQVQSQIDALNRDFRRRNVDSTTIPARFREFAADAEIEFALATSDPHGRATTGIIRKASNVNYWTLDDKIKFSSQGGDDAWDSRYYLNIWVGNIDEVLGYSSSPGSPAAKDGIVISNRAFGTINMSGPYHLGRTAVHEAGHWLGLKHIWGDTYCGDDLVDDTPKQGNFTSGCPSIFRSSCDNGKLGDMYMNFMDFTDDACLTLFTKGQKQRMQSVFKAGGARSSILSSKGLQQPWVSDEAPVDTAVVTPVVRFRAYPNPSASDIVLEFGNPSNWTGRQLFVTDLSGRVLLTVTVTGAQQKVSLNSLRPGVYFLRGQAGGLRLETKIIKL